MNKREPAVLDKNNAINEPMFRIIGIIKYILLLSNNQMCVMFIINGYI